MHGIVAPLAGQDLDPDGFVWCAQAAPGVACGWCAHVATALPVLQSLTQVTAVYGGLDVPADVDVGGSACPHVRELGETWYSFPASLFPGCLPTTCCP
jgi:hypothetical protein